jgi:hypothetical protein
MLGMLKKMEDSLAAVAFAEARETETAMAMAGVEDCGIGVSDVYAAAAFAEAGCHEEARQMLGMTPKRLAPTPKVCGFLESVGLSGVRVAYGLAEV